jgi:hypothetical protein
MAQLVQDCVAEDPAARPTAVQLARRLAEYSRLLQIKLEDKLADDAFRMVVPGRAP